jgi:hypothetical protein
MGYKCEHFALHELVPAAVLADRGEKAWELLDDRLLITLDRLRERYGKMRMNNYFWGGEDQFRGLRTPDSPDFTQYSQHSFGRAADPIFQDVTAEQVRKDALADPDAPCFEYINSIELGVLWFHFDTRNCTRIKTYTP